MVDSSEHSHSVARTVPSLLSTMLRASNGILELLPIATFICDAKGTILQYNRHAVAVWGAKPGPGQTHDQFRESMRFFELDGTPVARSMVSEVLETGEPVRDVERIVEHADGTRLVVSVNIDPLRNLKGELVGAVNCFLDVTDRKRADAALEQSHLHALEQEQRLAATYEHAAIGISEVDPDGRFLRVNEAICAITGYSRDELLAGKLFLYTHPDDADPDREGFRKQVAGELEFYSVEKRFVRKDGRVIWLSVRSSPVRGAGNRLRYVVRVVQDITERKAAEQRQKLLMDELNHRVKNTLATVQSLASQTARGTHTPAAFRERFEGRLIALSKAHDQLTTHHWESADLRELLSGSLAPYGGAGAERVVLRGEDVVLRPRAVLTLAMAVHELTTNAAKYGALSAPGGRIEIHWQPVRAGNSSPVLRIDWLEQGGPPVAEPDQRGFGSKLIEGSIAAELGGTARLAFEPQGLHCQIEVPLENAALDFRAKAGEEGMV
ncbi:MAG TPA: PAS domain S-box protein [Pseudolabrys sp.]|jgi:PAS domain S-box-containing protein|nr:PAS domain S-box protein [Pseudolabrys sp.]